jgi:hypothetical protein
MRKLTLKLDELAVETFETAAKLEDRGTVHGAESTAAQVICTCTYGEETCAETCQNCGSAYPCGGTGGGPNTDAYTCATGHQVFCQCLG